MPCFGLPPFLCLPVLQAVMTTLQRSGTSASARCSTPCLHTTPSSAQCAGSRAAGMCCSQPALIDRCVCGGGVQHVQAMPLVSNTTTASAFLGAHLVPEARPASNTVDVSAGCAAKYSSCCLHTHPMQTAASRRLNTTSGKKLPQHSGSLPAGCVLWRLQRQFGLGVCSGCCCC